MKRAGAIIAIILLVGLYVTTLICALIGNDFATNMLKASVFGTIFIPVLLYCYMFLFKAFNKETVIIVEDNEDAGKNDSKDVNIDEKNDSEDVVIDEKNDTIK